MIEKTGANFKEFGCWGVMQFTPSPLKKFCLSFINQTFFVLTILEEHITDISKLCLTYKVKQLFAFGSVLTENFNNDSDIDLIVDFEPIDIAQYADNYYDFKFSLEDIFKKPVDLLEEQAIKNPYFRQAIDKQRQLIYGRSSVKNRTYKGGSHPFFHWKNGLRTIN